VRTNASVFYANQGCAAGDASSASPARALADEAVDTATVAAVGLVAFVRAQFGLVVEVVLAGAASRLGSWWYMSRISGAQRSGFN
jgi:hypothetical protein